jgi:hypothetical protein
MHHGHGSSGASPAEWAELARVLLRRKDTDGKPGVIARWSMHIVLNPRMEQEFQTADMTCAIVARDITT